MNWAEVVVAGLGVAGLGRPTAYATGAPKVPSPLPSITATSKER